MALYHKQDVKNDSAYVLQFFSLISDGLGSVLVKYICLVLINRHSFFLNYSFLQNKEKIKYALNNIDLSRCSFFVLKEFPLV